MNDFHLQGRVVVITGGAGRLGSRFAEAVLQHGGKVARIDPGFQEPSQGSDNELQLPADITKPEQLHEAKEEIKKKLGAIYGLVNTACIQPKGFFDRVEDYRLETWKTVMSINLDGLFLCSQIFGSEMAGNGEGSIVNISSIYGIGGPHASLYEGFAFNTPPCYAASKAAVLGLTKYLAAYWGKQGVRTNAVTPGGVQDAHSELFVSRYSERTPLGRMAQKHEMNGAVIYLLSEASSYVTGHNLVVDGGWSAW